MNLELFIADYKPDTFTFTFTFTLSPFRYTDTVLTDKDCENIYELVYSSHRAVAQAAGDFLNAKLFSMPLDEQTRNIKTKKGKKRAENTPRVRDLVQFFIESEVCMFMDWM